ncbi:hypothetical protein N657DRAFT_211739 [Parathielavia appendiculata]|uniref:Uncharacterized protein n=1 Tax=Parathielavia appendiculata TaxID=2587402 RepID=A0AAN6U6T1_9PEZI|nr:hypothetical protein N657DRAFT_211739 [Parathielavia appendiculata]
MASATIPKPLPTSPRPSIHTNGSDHGPVACMTPTRPVPRPTSPPLTIRLCLDRPDITTRDVGQTAAPTAWHHDPFREAGEFRTTPGRLYNRKDTLDSTVPSKDHSDTWSTDDSDATSDNSHSPPAPLRRFVSVPPPQPLPPRGNPRFLPPPPWHPPVGPGGVRPRPLRPPARNAREADSAYSEFEYEGSDDGATKSMPGRSTRRYELQQEFQDKQRSIWQLRHEMSRKRKELRDLRRRKDDLDNGVMQIFRAHLTSKSRVAVIAMDVLEEKLRDMQAVRDEYYTAESLYETMEAKMDTEESELELLELELSGLPPSRVIPGPVVQLPPPPPTMKAPGIVEVKKQGENLNNDIEPAPPSPVTLLGISGDLPEDIHPFYEELLEAAGDHQLAKEYVEDIEMHRERILYDLEIELHRKRVRENQGNQISEADLHSLRSSLEKVPTDAAEFEARFGITITEDDLDFLRDYELRSKRARKELDFATENLSHLRALCLKKGVMRKHASYHEELAIFSDSPDWSPLPQDGNMAIEPPPRTPPAANNTTPSLAHPRFPILLSNPSHVLSLQTPLQALEQALKLPKDDPASALRRAECMKELGISTLMTKADNTPDYINQWLIHRLRTTPLEAELLLAVCEAEFRVVNLRRWQEDVLFYWRLDEAANVEVGVFDGAVSPRYPYPDGGVELGRWMGDGGGGSFGGKVNSVIEDEGRVRSDDGEAVSPGVVKGKARSVRSLG